MKNFRTLSGKRWTLRLNVGTIVRVEADTGFRLTDIVSRPESAGELFGDDMLFVQVLAAAVRDEISAAGMTEDAFLEDIDGAVICTAGDALVAELEAFFPLSVDSLPPGPAKDRAQKAFDRRWSKVMANAKGEEPCESPDPLEFCFELAGVCGVSPMEFTLRELDIMAWGKTCETWKHTCAVIGAIYAVNSDPEKGPPPHPWKWHPYLPEPPEPEAPPVDPSILKKFGFKVVPKTPQATPAAQS